MATHAGDHLPIISEIRLAGLIDSDGLAVEAGEYHEGERYCDADLSDHDLASASFSECEFVGVNLDGASLRAVRFVESRLTQVMAPSFSAPRSDWRDVEIDRSRLGAAELYEAELQSVQFTGCKVTYLNLRAARLRDVEFRGCTIDELDLSQVRAERVRFVDCAARSVVFEHAQLQHVDLRGLDVSGALSGVGAMKGSIISTIQAAHFSEAFTTHLGIAVIDDDTR